MDIVRILRLQREACVANPVPTLRQRRADLDTLGRFIREQREALIEAVSADYGHRSRHETLLAEIVPALSAIAHATRHLREWLRPQRRECDWLLFPGARNRVVPQPLGVVGVIVPWNFPINLSFVPLAAILAAGNRAMVKLSEKSPQLAALLVAQLPKYFPPEKLAVIAETGGLGEQFSRLPFDHLLFTGSGATGSKVMAAAAANLCPVTLELGGKSPAVVCRDFPLKLAAERILFGKLLNAGQVCTAVDYAFVPSERIGEFVALAREIIAHRQAGLGDPGYTSIIDRTAFERLRAALHEAAGRGARVLPLLEGPPWDEATRKIAPHLVLDAPPDCALLSREIFGPILPLIGYRDLEEAMRFIAARPRPLALYPFCRDRRILGELLDRLMSGGVTVNDTLLHVAQDDLPFGGVGASGMGHYHGRDGFVSFSKLRPEFRQARFSASRLLWPPYDRFATALLEFLSR